MKFKRELKQVEKTFKLTDEEFKKVESFRYNKGRLFYDYDVADIAKECGFYDRMFTWFKKECKNCTFSYWEDTEVYVYDKENKSFTLRGKEMKIAPVKE